MTPLACDTRWQQRQPHHSRPTQRTKEAVSTRHATGHDETPVSGRVWLAYRVLCCGRYGAVTVSHRTTAWGSVDRQLLRADGYGTPALTRSLVLLCQYVLQVGEVPEAPDDFTGGPVVLGQVCAGAHLLCERAARTSSMERQQQQQQRARADTPT